jgi:hypothetical protein
MSVIELLAVMDNCKHLCDCASNQRARQFDHSKPCCHCRSVEDHLQLENGAVGAKQGHKAIPEKPSHVRTVSNTL